MSGVHIFVSHPREDAALAGALAELLMEGCGLGADQVFCSSRPGVRIPAGRDFNEYMRQRLEGTTLLVQLVTPAYLDSVFCMFELGAAWVKGIETFPLVVPPVEFSHLDAITGGVEARVITDSNGLDELFRRATTHLETVDLDRWRGKRKTFKSLFTRKYSKQVSERRSVSMTEFDSVTEDLRHAQQRAKVAETVEPHAEVSGLLRDAYYFLEHSDPEDFGDEQVFRLLRDAARRTAAIFSAVCEVRCRCVVKWLEEPPSEPIGLAQWPIQDLVRSDRPASFQPTVDVVGGNTDFEEILERSQPHFLGNDLVAMYRNGDYKNSHWTPADVEDGRVKYRSALVVPIGRFLEDGRVAVAVGAQIDLLGFLCIDSVETNVFDPDRDIPLAEHLAGDFFPVLYLYRDLAYGDGDRSHSLDE